MKSVHIDYVLYILVLYIHFISTISICFITLFVYLFIYFIIYMYLFSCPSPLDTLFSLSTCIFCPIIKYTHTVWGFVEFKYEVNP